MIGRRVQPDEHGWPPNLEAGDYCRVAPQRRGDGTEFTEDEKREWWTQPYWICCAPNGHGGNLARHTVIEHEDGTITVSPSILISTSRDGGKTMIELWHGYLERGVWRSC